MITLVLFKIAVTALIVLLVMMMINSFCNYEDIDKGHVKIGVPTFVPYVGIITGVVMVICVIAAILIGVWS
jgi:hypothetical protein